jgi:hypothetical protein
MPMPCHGWWSWCYWACPIDSAPTALSLIILCKQKVGVGKGYGIDIQKLVWYISDINHPIQKISLTYPILVQRCLWYIPEISLVYYIQVTSMVYLQDVFLPI